MKRPLPDQPRMAQQPFLEVEQQLDRPIELIGRRGRLLVRPPKVPVDELREVSAVVASLDDLEPPLDGWNDRRRV